MRQTQQPMRSVLYIPGSNARALEKAKTLPVDAIIFDLEDAVAPDQKTNARAQLKTALAEGGYGQRCCLVRVNGLNTNWGQDDIQAFAGASIDGILIPKVDSAAQLDEISALCPELPLWAMMETPRGILNAAEIADHPRLAGFILGTNDLAKDLNCRNRADREPLLTSLQMCLLAARAAGIACVDGVYNAFKDTDGLRVECEQGRDMGFDGKTLIHPAQVEIANGAFGPGEEAVELAQRQIDAFEAARASGKGVAVVDGQIVENLHIETAQAILAQHRAIIANQGE